MRRFKRQFGDKPLQRFIRALTSFTPIPAVQNTFLPFSYLYDSTQSVCRTAQFDFAGIRTTTPKYSQRFGTQ
jgi:hypothetical protein